MARNITDVRIVKGNKKSHAAELRGTKKSVDFLYKKRFAFLCINPF